LANLLRFLRLTATYSTTRIAITTGDENNRKYVNTSTTRATSGSARYSVCLGVKMNVASKQLR